jgi:hypothetical protein
LQRAPAEDVCISHPRHVISSVLERHVVSPTAFQLSSIGTYAPSTAASGEDVVIYGVVPTDPTSQIEPFNTCSSHLHLSDVLNAFELERLLLQDIIPPNIQCYHNLSNRSFIHSFAHTTFVFSVSALLTQAASHSSFLLFLHSVTLSSPGTLRNNAYHTRFSTGCRPSHCCL